MTMKNICKYIVAAVMLLLPSLAGAQALPFVAVEFNAASLGKAGADIVETRSAAHSAFSNAAAIPFAETDLDVAAGYTMWGPTSGNVIMASGAYNLKGKLGVAAGFSYGMNPAYNITNNGGTGSGTFTPSDMHLGVGVSYRFLDFLSVGANVGYATSTLTKDISYGAVTADVFVMGSFAGLKVALGASNLGTSVTSANGVSSPLPSSVTLGAGYGKTFADKHGIDILLDADYFLAGSIAAALGAQYTFNDFVSVRAGYRYGGDSPMPSFASVGAGVKFAGVKLDLAYVLGSEVMGNTLAVGLGYCF